MDLRICFEPHQKMEINDISVFEYYASNYLVDFEKAQFAGYISMNIVDKDENRFEPVWQFIMDDVTVDTKMALLSLVQTNPLNGYHVHVYQKDKNENPVKIF